MSFSIFALSKRGHSWALIIAAAQISQLANAQPAAPLADARPSTAVAAVADTPLTMEEAARLSLRRSTSADRARSENSSGGSAGDRRGAIARSEALRRTQRAADRYLGSLQHPPR